MDGSLESAEILLGAALEAVASEGDEMHQALNALPAAIYVTDAEGRISFYNHACVPLAGRVPQAGVDQWCVTWKLYTLDGEFLPHAACPMAVAIKERRQVRGIEAFAERPDGSRIRFQPFPTPLYDDDGAFVGAINMLIDVTDRRRADDLRLQAERCRRLTNSVLDRQTIAALTSMAGEYDEEADRLSRAN